MAFVARPASSSAVKIVKPPSAQDEGLKSSTPHKYSSQRQCRNIMIYGSCKYQDKGCVYYHPPSPPAKSASPSSLDRPISPPTTLSATAVNAPIFIPKSASVIGTFPSSTPPPPQLRNPLPIAAPSPTRRKPTPIPPSDYPQSQTAFSHSQALHAQSQPFQPRSQPLPPQSKSSRHASDSDPYLYSPSPEHDDEHDPYDPYSYPPSNGNNTDVQMEQPDQYYSSSSQSYAHDIQALMDPYSGPAAVKVYDNTNPYVEHYQAFHQLPRQPLMYHLYTPPTDGIGASMIKESHFLPSSDIFIQSLQHRSEVLFTTIPAHTSTSLPDELQGYHSISPLEQTVGERRKFGNWYSVVYKARQAEDGSSVVLRRIENYRLTHQAAFGAIDKWSRIHHPNLVGVREAFTTRAFNDNSLVVTYTYHPTSTTLYSMYLSSRSQSTPIPERVLWSYVVQLASAIRRVHQEGMAVRMIDATKILVTGKNRVRISSTGVVDVLTYNPNLPPTPEQIHLLQLEDLHSLGCLLFALCTSNLAAINNLPKTLEAVGRTYSSELKNVGLWLLGKGAHQVHDIGQFFDMIGNRVVVEADDALTAVDTLEGQLMSELENARLVRLLSKFGFINERPEFAREPRWSETGDRYIIKLFRDYVFHQVDEQGNPIVNMSHVLTCLNKLDAGVDERIMLVSRDEQSCLVVSYKDVKSYVEAAFGDLTKGSG